MTLDNIPHMYRAMKNWFKFVRFIKRQRIRGNVNFTILTHESGMTICRVDNPSKGSIKLNY